ncbi:hypothetical protein A3I53_01160 [Candidatus Curtissbacteria bacterium RIFCSPLOWO2_02_FULL_40_13b]|uniref:Uncharacterized protein n=1 Tax=Candidatus Curtissbacteria bacterium RIFCSPLOWO2_02_FULL_40_13b TaxID=1797733 RepID=A0A1F5HRK5_9BACT|nr:MAG: hypothetical protein A3I53_01160 [Candidatus Curtissbacteria bacterium RIFCSPLOWO2_02_FULL_40_13b]
MNGSSRISRSQSEFRVTLADVGAIKGTVAKFKIKKNSTKKNFLIMLIMKWKTLNFSVTLRLCSGQALR